MVPALAGAQGDIRAWRFNWANISQGPPRSPCGPSSLAPRRAFEAAALRCGGVRSNYHTVLTTPSVLCRPTYLRLTSPCVVILPNLTTECNLACLLMPAKQTAPNPVITDGTFQGDLICRQCEGFAGERRRGNLVTLARSEPHGSPGFISRRTGSPLSATSQSLGPSLLHSTLTATGNESPPRNLLRVPPTAVRGGRGVNPLNQDLWHRTHSRTTAMAESRGRCELW